MSNTETVADDQDTGAQPAVDDKGAQGQSLDETLNAIDGEFDKDTKGSRTEPDQDNVKLADLQSKVDQMSTQMTDSDINKAVDVIAESIDKEVPKPALKGMLSNMAVDDPRITKAFENRYNDPKAWQKVLGAATKTIAKEFANLPDKQLNDDRDAVSNAVRGASNTTSKDETPNLDKLSDPEFETYKRTGELPGQ